MRFLHAPQTWAAHPDLVPLALSFDGVRPDLPASPRIPALIERARARLGTGSESDLPSIQAWRRAFSRMGLKPTQYRCAAEALLRRLRRGEPVPPVHPLVDFYNAMSMAWAIPIGVFDVSAIDGTLRARPARGDERYEDLAGNVEFPAPGEIVFADDAGHAHTRRWCHRQSGASAVRDGTRQVLLVAEAMHAGARAEIDAMAAELIAALRDDWGLHAQGRVLDAGSPAFEFAIGSGR